MYKQTTGERLKILMKERHLKQSEILELCRPYSEELGVKIGKNDLSQYVTDKFQPGTDKLFLLSKALRVNEVWLLGYNVPAEIDALNLFDDDLNETLSIKEQNHINTLRGLNDFGKEKVYDYAKDLSQSAPYLKETTTISDSTIIKLPTYDDIRASAGLGSYTDGRSKPTYHPYELTNITRKADHAIRIKGDSMEPIIKDGTIAFVLEQPMVNFGEIGIFVYQDEIYCKELIKEKGKIILRSKNKAYKDLVIDNEYPLVTVGKVLL